MTGLLLQVLLFLLLRLSTLSSDELLVVRDYFLIDDVAELGLRDLAVPRPVEQAEDTLKFFLSKLNTRMEKHCVELFLVQPKVSVCIEQAKPFPNASS